MLRTFRAPGGGRFYFPGLRCVTSPPQSRLCRDSSRLSIFGEGELLRMALHAYISGL